MRSICLPAGVVAFALFALLPLHGPVLTRAMEVGAFPISLREDKPDRSAVGHLVFLAGFDLVSRHAHFGGLSGLEISPDGRTLHAVSDHGYWLTAVLHHDTHGRLVAVDGWRSSPVLTPRLKRAKGRLRDAEGLTRDATGSFAVSFEGEHRIWRYPPSLAGGFPTQPRVLPTPKELAGAPRNQGLEAITDLNGLGLMAITEGYENSDGTLKGWLFLKEKIHPIRYQRAGGYAPTAVASLPTGDVLLLERRFSLFNMKARLQKIAGDTIRAGARLRGREIALLSHPLAVENYEGLAVRSDADLGTFVYLVSDDNFIPLQRTLLLQFRLLPE